MESTIVYVKVDIHHGCNLKFKSEHHDKRKCFRVRPASSIVKNLIKTVWSLLSFYARRYNIYEGKYIFLLSLYWYCDYDDDNKFSIRLFIYTHTTLLLLYFEFGSNLRWHYTECPKIYRKYEIHLLKYSTTLYLSRCSTDLR